MSGLFTENDIIRMKQLGRLIAVNPFSLERKELEKAILGRRYRGLDRVWHAERGNLSVNKNLEPIFEACTELIGKGLSRFGHGTDVSTDVLEDWDILALYWLFAKYSGPMCSNIYLGLEAETRSAGVYGDFLEDFNRLLCFPGRIQPSAYAPAKVFALCHQIHRAFNFIFDSFAGATCAAEGLRTRIWQSIFTVDMFRYYRNLDGKYPAQPTLITGDSGTGKELVAQALAYSQYIPFNERKRCFASSYKNAFHPVLLSALPQSLVDSELFGHVVGAYTGATQDKQGYFEICQPGESIFLDEIGETSIETQVKLLRLLQNRQFQKIGDTAIHAFQGKVIAATNADLPQACTNGRFRKDLLFRLCSDTIQTIPLRTLLDGQPEELYHFIHVLVNRFMSPSEAGRFAEESLQWILTHLGINYEWPGNVRELAQCLRNLYIHQNYTPLFGQSPAPVGETLENMLAEAGLTAAELLEKYVGVVYRQTGTVSATALATGLNRRTVKKYLDGKR